MDCLPATIQWFKWLLLLILAHCAVFLSDVLLLNHSYLSFSPYDSAVRPASRNASQARRRSLLIIANKSTITGVLRPKAQVSHLSTYLSTRGMKDSNAMNAAVETQRNLTHLAPMASFPPTSWNVCSSEDCWM